jgi:AraC-like DNA-binding protein
MWQYGKSHYRDWDGRFLSLEADKETNLRTNTLPGTVAAYAFAIVLNGTSTLLYSGREITIERDHLFIYMPGFPIRIKDVSEDFAGLWLVADESFTVETPSIRNAVRSALLPIFEMRQPVVGISPEECARLSSLIRMAGEYLVSENPLREEMLGNLYAIFLMDLSSILSRQSKRGGFGKRTEELFMNFIDLLPKHFIREHGLEFYADALNVTPTYLSRAVRQVSGRTVVEYINRLLLMEAIWLLESTALSIDEIAERINYADSTTFGRFFFRMKGVTPREYRKSLFKISS